MNPTSNDTAHDGELSAAVARSEDGAQAWASAVRHQCGATPDHSDPYFLAGEMVATLRALDAIAGILVGQVAGYSTGRAVYDDEGANPAHRLRVAVLALAEARHGLAEADSAVNHFWSAIGHIGVNHEAGGRS